MKTQKEVLFVLLFFMIMARLGSAPPRRIKRRSQVCRNAYLKPFLSLACMASHDNYLCLADDACVDKKEDTDISKGQMGLKNLLMIQHLKALSPFSAGGAGRCGRLQRRPASRLRVT